MTKGELIAVTTALLVLAAAIGTVADYARETRESCVMIEGAGAALE